MPVGVETDLASVPHIAQFVPEFSSTGLSRRPGVLHDYLYQSGDVPRMEADRLFYVALLADGILEPIAGIYHRVVRMFGRERWDACRAS